MQYHTKIYLNHFDYTIADFIPSEISGKRAGAVHHIHRRGMGGNYEDMERIENYMTVTDQEHEEYGEKVEFKAYLYKIHKLRLQKLGKPFNEVWIDAQIEKYS